jgi:pyruvate/2-oxoglutarate dehydrogenase complex dihydrolipoamide dehydrogenase (E3) component
MPANSNALIYMRVILPRSHSHCISLVPRSKIPQFSSFQMVRYSRAMSSHYDAVIIGSGQGGTPLASAFAKAKYKTALIESGHVGGSCINEGCTPTKTMVASGRVAYLARRGPDYGVQTGDPEAGHGVQVEMEKVRQRKRDIVSSFREGSERRLRDSGVTLLMGRARFKDARTVEVGLGDGTSTTITADRFFINTGERPAKPKFEGLYAHGSDSPFPPYSNIILDSTSVQELAIIPEHLVVLGGGYIGLEFGQLFRRLGAQVTIIQRGKQLLPREDAEVAKTMLEILREDGINVHLRTQAQKIQPMTVGFPGFILTADEGDREIEISGSHLLLAAGRVPNTDDLNLDAAGVKTNRKGYISTNEQLETTAPNIWALGDVKGPPAFTHISYDDFRILKANLIEKTAQPLTITNRVVPYVVYTDPQLGHVGFHEEEVRAKFPGRKIQTAQMPMSYVARALETDETRGMMKAIVDAETKQILGFTCLGLEGGEVMSIVQMAMMGGVEWTKLRDAVWAHPSLAESLNNLWGFLK